MKTSRPPQWTKQTEWTGALQWSSKTYSRLRRTSRHWAWRSLKFTSSRNCSMWTYMPRNLRTTQCIWMTSLSSRRLSLKATWTRRWTWTLRWTQWLTWACGRNRSRAGITRRSYNKRGYLQKNTKVQKTPDTLAMPIKLLMQEANSITKFLKKTAH